MKKLNNILKGINIDKSIGNMNISINDIHFDSRNVNKNSLFVAMQGIGTDGHKYINKSILNGAVIIVCENLPNEIDKNICYIKVKDSSEALCIIASNFYDNPSKKIKLIGITGTNGKTTIATLLYKLFKRLAYKVGLISTVTNYVNDIEKKAYHTTPDAIYLNYLLNDMVENKCEYCFMEVSSHGIALNRIFGVEFNGAVFTNISHEHLDFHKTYKEYIYTKKQFFDNLSENSFALTNIDDKNGSVMLQNTKALKRSYAVKTDADYRLSILENDFSGMLLTINNTDMYTQFVGEFNAYNILAIYSTAMLLNQDKIKVLSIISELSSVKGRFDTIKIGNIIGIVDYAHTPDALENVLNTINKAKGKKQKLITVVGAGGNRDSKKRPIMAKISAISSDKVILTSDNPRFENPEDIIDEMVKGIDSFNKKNVIKITNRKEAIKTACILANSGDIVLIAGKGHEDYQEIKGVRYDFDDKKIFRELMNEICN